ncbi:MAG: efflux RND transporter periplasmic adaptor subunit [Balneolaceae bacterium]
MNTRKLSVVAGLVIFLLSVVSAWFLINFEDDEEDTTPETEPTEVRFMEYSPTSIRSSISFTGRVIPYDQYDIYSEVTGIFEEGARGFKTGTEFSRGETLIRVNDEEERQQIQSARHEFAALISQLLPDISIDYPDHYDNWEQYLDNFDASESLSPLPQVLDRQFRLFLNRQNVFSRFYSIRQQEVRLDKFTIRAPYDGVVTEHAVNPGALVQNGQRLGQFTGTGNLEIEASVPAVQSSYISVGDSVSLQTDALREQNLRAAVTRKNALISPGTQNVKIYISVSEGGLSAGEYLSGEIYGQEFSSAFKIHKDILVRDSELFVVDGDRARIRSVNLLSSAGDSMIVSGLEEGDIILDEFRDAAFEDTRVTEREEQ